MLIGFTSVLIFFDECLFVVAVQSTFPNVDRHTIALAFCV